MQKTPAKQFFPALESLRGLAALSVVFFHLPPWYQPFYSIGFIRNGNLMVDFFFVLSGFVMSLNYANKVHSRRQLGEFALLRAVRLYPVHFVYLMLFLAVEVAKYLAAQKGYASANSTPFKENSATAFVLNLVLAQSLGLIKDMGATFNGPSWSISTEYYTYLVFGLALLTLGAKRLTTVSALIATAAGVAYLMLTPDLAHFAELIRCLFGFFTGCLVYALYGKARKWPEFLTPVILVAIVGYLSFEHIARPVSVMVPLAAALIVSVISGASPAWLDRRPARWLGLISYSLYMSHALTLWVANQVLRFAFKFPDHSSEIGTFPSLPLPAALVIYPITLLFCVGVGALTYWLVEEPSLRLSKRLKARFSKSVATNLAP